MAQQYGSLLSRLVGEWRKQRLIPVRAWAVHMWKTNKPPRDKTNKRTVRPAKTQISLDMMAARVIRPVRSESSLCAQWVDKDTSFLHPDNEDSDQTERMPRLICVFAGRTCHFVGCVVNRLIFENILVLYYMTYKKICLHICWGEVTPN